MNHKEKYLLLKTVQDYNILPVTSACNMACRFCSHHQNPPGIQIYKFGHLNLEFIKELIEYLPVDGPVILGESATRIIEGDPFVHPGFSRILKIIRREKPGKEIRLTTNGSHLSPGMVQLLKNMEPIELNISLNCSNPADRVFLMCDPAPAAVFTGLELIDKYNIKFNGSIVAMPHLMGWQSLEDTVDLLARYNPRTIRVFLPGFTKYTSGDLKYSTDLYDRLFKTVSELNRKYRIPVLFEPPRLQDFRARVRGIIPDSAADVAGLQPSDVINKINGDRVETRVEAFNKLKTVASPQLQICRDNLELEIELNKSAGVKPGCVLDYDLPDWQLNKIKKLLNRTETKNIIMVTSRLAEDLIGCLLEKLSNEYSELHLKLLPVANVFFGGSIMVAGLLTNSDIITAIKEVDYKRYELIILPGIIYDFFGNDLNGSNYSEIEEETGIKVELI